MDQSNSIKITLERSELGRKSWTGYIGSCLLGIALLLLLTPFAWSVSAFAGVAALIISLAILVYQFMLLRSYRLYLDHDGVWIYSGVLPWNKGFAGVKWRDLDEATYFQSMGSWLFKSYSIRIGHRFTKSSEIVLSHWARGHEAVMTINEKHQQLVRTDTLR